MQNKEPKQQVVQQIKPPEKFDREKADRVIDRVIKENKEWLKEMANK